MCVRERNAGVLRFVSSGVCQYTGTQTTQAHRQHSYTRPLSHCVCVSELVCVACACVTCDVYCRSVCDLCVRVFVCACVRVLLRVRVSMSDVCA